MKPLIHFNVFITSSHFLLTDRPGTTHHSVADKHTQHRSDDILCILLYTWICSDECQPNLQIHSHLLIHKTLTQHLHSSFHSSRVKENLFCIRNDYLILMLSKARVT